MSFMSEHLGLTVFIVLLGAGMFLRIVAREKHRRERHLTMRLNEKIEELRKQANEAAEAAALHDSENAPEPASEEAVTAEPVAAA
jgi:hypothetical protein